MNLISRTVKREIAQIMRTVSPLYVSLLQFMAGGGGERRAERGRGCEEGRREGDGGRVGVGLEVGWVGVGVGEGGGEGGGV